jgi:glycosyltransferase involved in cell wall biosynthesis
MKIAFFCGSLEPGKDGVGDYVRLLASEVIMQGHHAVIVAINDTHLKKEYRGIQKARDIDVGVLRIPFTLSVRQRFTLARKWIDSLAPDWISVQFVPYAFHSKGLPLLSTFYLKGIIRKRRMQIMFHEMWVDGKNDGVKRKFTSIFQRFLIKKMLHLLMPSVIHTHIPFYQFRLKKLGFLLSKPLPLFSNICLLNRDQKQDQNIFRIGIFSQVENSKSIISFLAAVGRQVVERKIQLEVLLLGEKKSKMMDLGNMIERLENYKIRYTGFLTTEALSAALQSCTLGLTSVPRHLLGKSGSVAAFLAHGVPVAAPYAQKYYDAVQVGFFDSELCSSIVLEPELNQLCRAKQILFKAKEDIRLDKIAKNFLSDLKNSERQSLN